MRVIAHLSDLHFGKVSLNTVAPLIQAAHEAKPHLTVVSGDFVQWGTRREFEEARRFVEQLPRPRLLVPGNHDIPFANLWLRLSVGLKWYQRYISADLAPFYEDDELVAMGVNTARLFPLKGGRINEAQVRTVEQRLCDAAAGRWKVLVSHHPFDLAGTYHHRELVGRARMAMGRFAQTVDILLAGHMHVSHAGRTAVRYRLQGKAAVFVQAGTATSARDRGEPNAFNLVRLENTTVLVETHQWQPDMRRFACVCTDRFEDAREAASCAASGKAPEGEVEAMYGPE